MQRTVFCAVHLLELTCLNEVCAAAVAPVSSRYSSQLKSSSSSPHSISDREKERQVESETERNKEKQR